MGSPVTLEQIAELIKAGTEEAKIYKKELEETKARVHKLEQENAKILKEIENARERANIEETNRRKNNIIIYNVEEQPRMAQIELINTVIDFISINLGILLESRDIDFAFRLGKVVGKRPILIRFVSFWRKLEVMKASKILKGTNYAISNDYPQEVRVIRKKLLPYLIRARKEDCKVFMKNDVLSIDGRDYTVSELERENPTRNKISRKEGKSDSDGGSEKIRFSQKRKGRECASPSIKKLNSTTPSQSGAALGSDSGKEERRGEQEGDKL